MLILVRAFECNSIIRTTLENLLPSNEKDIINMCMNKINNYNYVTVHPFKRRFDTELGNQFCHTFHYVYAQITTDLFCEYILLDHCLVVVCIHNSL